jgi:hypothetical protein
MPRSRFATLAALFGSFLIACSQGSRDANALADLGTSAENDALDSDAGLRTSDSDSGLGVDAAASVPSTPPASIGPDRRGRDNPAPAPSVDEDLVSTRGSGGACSINRATHARSPMGVLAGLACTAILRRIRRGARAKRRGWAS